VKATRGPIRDEAAAVARGTGEALVPESELTNPKRTRLAAAERKAAILDCARRVFSDGSFRGTTTAEIAGAAGITEPILYRHFSSKRALYLACFEQSWSQVRELWDTAVAAEPDPAHWIRRMAIAYRNSGELKDVMSTLWLQALAAAGGARLRGGGPPPLAGSGRYPPRTERRHRGLAVPGDRAASCLGSLPGRPPHG
jgi:AcrR family transcriptional regulator